MPGEPFVDCWGTMRLGAWILERSWNTESDATYPELRFTLRVATAESLLVRKVLALQQVDGRWLGVRMGEEFAHRL